MLPDRSPLYTHEHAMRSRYSETDKMGYVYYARYLEYFEVARTEMIRAVGMPYEKMEADGVMLPVVESHVKYKAPLFYDQEFIIRVHMYDLPVIKLKTFYEMFTHGGQKLHATGEVNLCFVDAANRKPCRAPAEFINALQEACEE